MVSRTGNERLRPQTARRPATDPDILIDQADLHELLTKGLYELKLR